MGVWNGEGTEKARSPTPSEQPAHCWPQVGKGADFTFKQVEGFDGDVEADRSG